MILSVSRRTDIPAFYPEWFINRVREGFVYVPNPFNANQISRIPLSEDIVDCIVFWTKNPLPLLPYLPEIAEKYENAFYFQYTINAYDTDIEPAVPALAQRIEAFKELSETYGKDSVVWRYDPILLSEKYTMQWHIDAFKAVFSELKDYTDTCVISFVDMYDKTKNNTKPYGIAAPDTEQMNQLAAAFAEIARGSGVTIKTCAEGIDLDAYGIKHNSCIDKDRIEKITGFELKFRPDNQRSFCQCIECADIGQYNTCKHGCRYCYANYSPQRVASAVMAHDVRSPLLTGTLPKSCEIKEYGKAKSLKLKKLDPDSESEQLSLF